MKKNYSFRFDKSISSKGSPEPLSKKQEIVPVEPQSERYSHADYVELLEHIWSTQLTTTGSDCSETRLIKFMREHKIAQDKRQLDDLYKQNLWVPRG